MRRILFLFLLIFPLQFFAWNAAGHKVIAAIAYDHLSDEARFQVDQILKNSAEDYPYNSTFISASVWADQIKTKEGNHHYDSWHFISMPYSPDGSPLPAMPANNLVWAINHSIDTLKNKSASAKDKAASLRFLIHLVGDAHQPLHCISRVTKQFPQGDAGGNAVVIDSGIADNLHGYWDKGLGLLRYTYHGRRFSYFKLAGSIERKYPESYFTKTADLEPKDWTMESFTIAKNFVYNLEPGSRPSFEYNKEGRDIVAQQLALAGYRLANLLNNIYGNK